MNDFLKRMCNKSHVIYMPLQYDVRKKKFNFFFKQRKSLMHEAYLEQL